MSQFYPPFAPDMERMEMPYSVVLDFREDGGTGTLQVAKDGGVGQGGVLRGMSIISGILTWALKSSELQGNLGTLEFVTC